MCVGAIRDSWKHLTASVQISFTEVHVVRYHEGSLSVLCPRASHDSRKRSYGLENDHMLAAYHRPFTTDQIELVTVSQKAVHNRAVEGSH